jgi:lipopolysaccharide export system permease protein
MKILDFYIIRKFLGTFFFSLTLIISIAVVFDISEKLDDFLEKKAPLHAIIFDYYLNFIPFFSNLFSPLFVFIAVIFFTAKMANNTEIVAILNSGVSFKRLMFPYFLSATVIAGIAYYMNGWVIPPANKERLQFEEAYIRNQFVYKARHIHRQIKPGEFIYFDSFNNIDKIGYRFSYEKIKGKQLYYKLMSDRILWDSITGKWQVENYFIRHINGMNERIESGVSLDTSFDFHPSEFSRRLNNIETMNNRELDDFIREEQLRGSENVVFYLVEKHKRIALPFATFILTLIGVALASRKVRGGIGLQLGAGITLSFSYILFMQISNTFATNGSLPAAVAVWIPNFIYAIIGGVLMKYAPK